MGPEQILAPGPPRYATRGNCVTVSGRSTGKKGETLSLQRFMDDSQLNVAERP